MIHRSYFDKQATIIQNSYSNNSRNPVIELSYGGSIVSSSTNVSRYLFNIDLNPLIEKINSGEITNNKILSHKLKFTNVINLNDELIGTNMIKSRRSSGFDLILFESPEEFDEGTGYDYIYTDNISLNINKTAPNWFNRKNNQPWSINGCYDNTSTGLTILNTQRFVIGNENIDLDITEKINSILFSAGTTSGFGIAYSSSTENILDQVRNTVSFFSKYTYTFFEPYLETVYDNSIIDDRCHLYSDTNSKLVFNYSKPITNVDRVEILNQNGEIVQTISSLTYQVVSSLTLTTVTTSLTITENIKKQFNSTYYIDVNFDSDIYEINQNYNDVWYFNINNKLKNQTNSFTLLEYQDEFDYSSIKTHISINGIKSNDVLRNDSIKKVIFNSKFLNENKIYTNLKVNLKYKIYVRQGTQQIDVIPLTLANKLNDTFYDIIDLKWFIPNFYTIEAGFYDEFNNLIGDTNKTNFKIIE